MTNLPEDVPPLPDLIGREDDLRAWWQRYGGLP